MKSIVSEKHKLTSSWGHFALCHVMCLPENMLIDNVSRDLQSQTSRHMLTALPTLESKATETESEDNL